ncbi:uncharacterized protein BXIN_1774 [Babesia sp. Xinjiang]|uniref:uncharacterized protein n=1 Tax=Babesia sp. Xinjiang TaxID=462227 RepID=UPI000A22AD1F|nr:uncharacterized protein BXIN_1645 [Babesia sp. Xinjiang]XP_028871473.1 uncharacterized protein BXIN_1774 [Babesia sp. Xinjiang]ORM40898.1 hypothetical protein BXIN_1645 [Babesia sp. Xinjiang]ORM41017.1 hypothetical protein BXIN_1774 [Babesia sp. Xinjiang]
MFHPRPFGGSANIFAKSSKGEQENRNDGQLTSIPEPGASHPTNQERSEPLRRHAPSDGKASSFNRGQEHRRSMDDNQSFRDSRSFADSKLPAKGRLFSDRRLFSGSRPLVDPKDFSDLKPLAEPKGFDDMRLQPPSTGVEIASATNDTPEELQKIVVPPDAPQKAASEGVYDKTYLLQLMMHFQKLYQEKGVAACKMDPPRFKFVDSHPPMQHNAGIRDFVNGPREGIMGGYGGVPQAMFDHGDPHRKSVDLVSGQRRSYFDQRIPKGKDAFRLTRDGFDGSDYPKRGDMQGLDQQIAEAHGRWNNYEAHSMRNERRFMYENYQSTEGLSLLDDERALQLGRIDHMKHVVPPFHSTPGGAGLHHESDVGLLSSLQSQRRPEHYNMHDRYPFDANQVRHAESLMSLGVDPASYRRPAGDMRFVKGGMMGHGIPTTGPSEQTLLQYTALAASAAKAPQTWKTTRELTLWQADAPPADEPIPADDSGVFDSPVLQGANQRVSFLERLLDKSFDSIESSLDNPILDTAAQLQKVMNLVASQMRSQSQEQEQAEPQTQEQDQPQEQPDVQTQPQVQPQPQVQTQPQVQSQPQVQIQPQVHIPSPQQIRRMEPPVLQTISLQWQYKDFHGEVHGFYSSSQMYTWYINNFFAPNLPMRYDERMPWTLFKDLYPPSYTPFVDPPLGYIPEAANQLTLQHTPGFIPSVSVGRPAVQEVETPAAEERVQAGDPVRASGLRWNKPDDVKVDSLLEIMEKQMRQSAPKSEPQVPASPVTTRPSPGWKVSDTTSGPVSVASDDFPSLALGAEKIPKSRKKSGGGSNQPQHQQSTMSLKAFMKYQAQLPDSTRGQPKDSFARKLMGDKK